MKQTLEEAAREAIHAHYNCNGEYPCGERDYCEHCNGHNTAFDCCECGADEFKEGFIASAQWQSKQSPWVSVKDRLPELGDPVLIRLKDGTVRLAVLDTDDNSDAYFWSDNYSYETISGWDTTHWMPIPPLKSNVNELERKEVD